MWQITEQNGAKPGGFLCREKRNASERLVHIMLTGAYAPKKEVFMCFSDKCRPDGIEADIIIEKIVESDMKLIKPICIKAKMASLPEDCGGPWGYEELLDILSDEKHERYKEK